LIGIYAGLIILYGTNSQKDLGIKIAKDCFDFLVSNEFCGDHDSFNIMKLIEKLHSMDLPLITDDVISAMKRRIAENVCYDRNQWNEYHPQPLDFADSPSSMWYDDVKTEIESNFDFWLDSITEEGVWEPNFSWGCDSDISRQVTKNWKGYIAVRRARIFTRYGAIDYTK
jgi:hypothetical protein